MKHLKMDLLHLGAQYTAIELAQMWGYKSYHALIRGVLTEPDNNTIVLFVTKEKAKGAIPYEDRIDDSILYMMGQNKHGTDSRIARNLQKPVDIFYLFYRDKHHTPFNYYGECKLLSATLKDDSPSEFEFLLLENGTADFDSDQVIDYYLNASSNDSVVVPMLEGGKVIVSHVKRERNPHNRKEAIRIHGHKCAICGFDFNIVYGEDLADNFIEVHHIKQLSEGEQLVDPAKDLIPVCANCHKMLHRKRQNNITIEQLKEQPSVKEFKSLIKELE